MVEAKGVKDEEAFRSMYGFRFIIHRYWRPLMAQAYTLIRGLGEFAAAREQFNYLVDRLQSKETAGMEHGEAV